MDDVLEDRAHRGGAGDRHVRERGDLRGLEQHVQLGSPSWKRAKSPTTREPGQGRSPPRPPSRCGDLKMPRSPGARRLLEVSVGTSTAVSAGGCCERSTAWIDVVVEGMRLDRPVPLPTRGSSRGRRTRPCPRRVGRLVHQLGLRQLGAPPPDPGLPGVARTWSWCPSPKSVVGPRRCRRRSGQGPLASGRSNPPSPGARRRVLKSKLAVDVSVPRAGRGREQYDVGAWRIGSPSCGRQQAGSIPTPSPRPRPH